MKQGISSISSPKCVYLDCEQMACGSTSTPQNPNSKLIVRKGFYWRKSDRKKIACYRCLKCRRSFSEATSAPFQWSKKRQVYGHIKNFLNSGVSMRRTARLLNLNRKTVARALDACAVVAQEQQDNYLNQRLSENKLVEEVQFDEMESSIHSKCLPVSIPLMVEKGSRKIIGFRVCSMPAHGKLAEISLKRYGKRADDRSKAVNALFESTRKFLAPQVRITSDMKSTYPKWIKTHFPDAQHKTTKGRRGCVVGQGELKSGGFDPLFSLNHTAAMFRANVNRLFRRTWCTSKRMDRLWAHMSLYMEYHNFTLTEC